MTQEQRLLWLLDQAMEREHSTSQVAVMAILLALDARGRAQISKLELGALVGLKERQVSTVLKELESTVHGYIKKQRSGGTGKGRAANFYVIRPDATGNEVPVTWNNQQPITGTEMPVDGNKQSSASSAVPSAPSNQQPVARENTIATSNAVPSACGEVLPPIKHGRARVEDNLKLRDITQLYPERTELAATAARVRLNGSAKGMRAHELMSHLIRIVDSPSLDARSVGLAKTCHELKNLIDDGADFDADIVPTVIELCGRKNGEPIKSMTYFSAAIRANAATRLRLEQQARNPITPAETDTHDQQRIGRSDNGANYGREKRNHHTDLLLRDVLDDSPSAVGGLDFIASK